MSPFCQPGGGKPGGTQSGLGWAERSQGVRLSAPLVREPLGAAGSAPDLPARPRALAGGRSLLASGRGCLLPAAPAVAPTN